MKRKYLILSIVAFIILIAVITNPGEDKHKSAVKAKILSLTLQKTADNGGEENSNPLAQAGAGIGSMIGGAIVEQLVNSAVSTDNYLLFSTTKITWNGETKVIGVGAFGNVFLSGKIEEGIKNGMGENKEAEEKAKMDSLFNAASKEAE